MITFEEFKKVDLRIGKIIKAENVEKSKKLLKLQVDVGEEERQILSGIAEFYNPEDLIGKEVVVVINLEPRKMMGLESQGMLLAAGSEEKPVILKPEEEVGAGSKIT
jgi:methionine--tRNA ligase beta chain